jgi:outer membrane protein assembly factor BamD (BamD/ComL family)
MNIRKLMAAFGVAAIISGASATLVASPHAYPEPTDRRSEREADLYEQGTDAVDEGDWADALRAFKKVAEMNGARAEEGVSVESVAGRRESARARGAPEQRPAGRSRPGR